MHVRSTVIDVDPERLEDAVGLMRDRVVPELDALPGSLGATMLANRVTGRTETSSMWGTRSAMEASLDVLGPLRDELVLLLGGEVLVEEWEVAELFRARRPVAGNATRSTRIAYDLADAEQLVEVFRTTAVPALALLDGFVSASLLVDIDRAAGMTLVTFTDRQAMEDSRRAAAEIRRTTVDKAHARATEVVEAELVIVAMHVPDQA